MAVGIPTHGFMRISISGPQAPKQHRVVTCLGFRLWDGVSSRTLKQGDDKGHILYPELPLSGTCLEISFLYEITSASPVQIPAWKLTPAAPSGSSRSQRLVYKHAQAFILMGTSWHWGPGTGSAEPCPPRWKTMGPRAENEAVL